MFETRGKTELLNFSSDELWQLNLLTEILEKIKAYADRNGLSDVVLASIEDNTFSDPVNQRFDIWIRYAPKEEGCIWTEQKLLMLKGEVMDCTEFGARHDEFYPKVV